MQVLVLCWHPGRSNFQTAGGFKRFYEILKLTQCEVVVLDKYPSIYTNLASNKVKVVEYGKGINTNWLTDRFISTWQLLSKIYRLKLRPSVIYVPFSELPHLSMSAVILKKYFNCRLILCNLNTNSLPLDRFLNNLLHKQADKIITLSKNLQINLKNQGILATDINGVGFSLPIKPKAYIKKTYDAVFVGRHTPEKGFFDLIEIWDLLVNQFQKKYSLLTVGDLAEPYKATINNKLSSLKLQKYIHIGGNISDFEKQNIYLKSKILVFPSLYEGWGIVPMEALSYGLPVIAYDLPVYREAISRNSAFITVAVHNKMLMARQIIKTLNNYSLLQKKTRLWKPKHSWDSIARNEWKLICQN